MTEHTLNSLDIVKNIEFIIKYCDLFLDYCHDENLSIDGNIAGEISESIGELEEYLENCDEKLEVDEIKDVYSHLKFIKEELCNLNDIKLFNNIHIVIGKVLEDTKKIIKRECEIEL